LQDGGHTYSTSFEEFKLRQEGRADEERREKKALDKKEKTLLDKKEETLVDKTELEMLSWGLKEVKFGDEDFFNCLLFTSFYYSFSLFNLLLQLLYYIITLANILK